MSKIEVMDTEISIQKVNGEDYISLTDMAGCKKSASRAADVIKNWIRTRFQLNF